MGPRQIPSESLPRPEAIHQPSLAGASGEVLPERQAEYEQGVASHERVEAARVESIAAPPVVAPVLPAPVPSSQDDTTQASDDNPVVAADDELIEKEWVDKAKQIIASTKDDPYEREQAIKQLQIDYVKKRYGRIIGENKDNEAA